MSVTGSNSRIKASWPHLNINNFMINTLEDWVNFFWISSTVKKQPIRVSSVFQPGRVGDDSYHNLKVKGWERIGRGGGSLNSRIHNLRILPKTIVLCNFMKSHSPSK